MKKFRVLVVVAALVMALASVSVAFAQQPAYETGVITSITFQNVTDEAARLTVDIYKSSATPFATTALDVPANSGNSLYMGDLVTGNLAGSAVLSSDKEIVATAVQIPQSTTVTNRALSNGFKAGSSEVLLATVLKNTFNFTSQFAIQNAGTGTTDIVVKFYEVNNTTPVATITETGIAPGVSKYFDAGKLSEVPDPFNGSATVTASSGSIVGSVIEAQTNGNAIYAFEGVNSGAPTVFMATALCDAFGGANTAYAVQNTSASATANVTVNYSNGNSDTAQIGPGGKNSFVGCAVNSANFSGAASIVSTGADIVVIGKVYGAGLGTAFLGEGSGSDKLALPYVRWTSDANFNSGSRQRTFLAIQNISNSDVSNVRVRYLDKAGNEVGVDTITSIDAGAKANSTPFSATGDSAKLLEFGYPESNGGGFGGSVIIEGPAGSELIAIARVQAKDTNTNLNVAEDYNGASVDTE